MNVKNELYDRCCQFVAQKLLNIQDIMASNQLALEGESKSSAGDKHETGRAMLHLEMEKASQQFAVISKMKETLDKIDTSLLSEHIKLGSLITTDSGSYYLSISAGSLKINDKEYYAISPSSPIGASLLGEKKGAVISLGQRRIKILEVQ